MEKAETLINLFTALSMETLANMDNYPSEFVKPLKLCIEILNKCNIRLFDKTSSSKVTYFSYIFKSLCAILHYVSLTIFLIKVFGETNAALNLAFTVPVYVVFTQGILEAVILFFNKTEIEAIVHELGATWRMENLSKVQINKKHALLRKLEICQKGFYHMAMIGSYLYILTPLMELFLRRFIWQQQVKLALPFPGSFPFDPFQNWIVYAGIYMFQIYSTYPFIYAYLGPQFLMVALCSHIVTEFSLLQEDILNLKKVNYTNERDAGVALRNLVRNHQRLIKLSQQLDAIFNKINFIIFCFVTIAVCFFAFGGKVSQGMFKVVNYNAVVGVLVPLFILCYYSGLLRIESAGIANAAYNILWYNEATDYRKSIALIIMRAQKPCCLTSLKYSPITLKTFSKVLRTTWSYFSLLSSLTTEIK